MADDGWQGIIDYPIMFEWIYSAKNPHKKYNNKYTLEVKRDLSVKIGYKSIVFETTLSLFKGGRSYTFMAHISDHTTLFNDMENIGIKVDKEDDVKMISAQMYIISYINLEHLACS